jgi:Tol biopolymer transport system component
LETQGEAIPIVEDVMPNRNSYRGVFSTSANGMLVYQAGGDSGTWQLQWADRDGKLIESLPGQATFREPEISPDGKRIVVGFADLGGTSNSDLWILDTVRGTRTRLTFDPAGHRMPFWTPDGRKIIYISNRKGKNDIYTKSADGSGNDEIVLGDDSDKAWPSISRDGRYLAYQRRVNGSTTGDDIWVLPLFGDRKPFPLVQSPFFDGTPAISPDGKWLAYSSDESHRREIYVTPFPGGGSKWEVSTAGGLSPKWRGDSRELYFLSYDGSLNAVDVSEAAGSLVLGTPHSLFSGTLEAGNFGPYDVSLDGKRFLLNGAGGSGRGSTPLTLVTNWTADLKK